MEETVQAFLGRIDELPLWGVYLFFFVSAVLQIVFPPYPGDSVLIFGGYLASKWLQGGNAYILFPYWLGTLICSLSLYELGVWKGEKLLGIKIVSQYFPSSKQEKARNWLLKYGITAILLCKFVPGLNSLIIIFSGIFRYNRMLAYIGIGFATVMHNVLFFITGRFVGDNWGNIGKFLSVYNKTVISTSIAAIIIYGSCRLWMYVRKRKLPDA